MTSTLNIMCSDVGEEIDDEVAIHQLIQTSENENWLIILVPGASNVDPTKSGAEVQKRIARFTQLFQYFEVSTDPSITGWYNKWSNDQNSNFYVGDVNMINSPNLFAQELGCRPVRTVNIESTRIYLENFIQIAPLWHINADYFKRFQIQKFIVMGDIENPHNSINLTKAIPSDCADLLVEYHEQQATIQSNSKEIFAIPTSMARNVPMPYSLMKKLPENLREPLLSTAFVQLVGRVPAHLPYANNISIINHKTILNYCSEHERNDILNNEGVNIISEPIRLNIEQQVHYFLQNASEKDQHDKAYIRRLRDIAQAIYLVIHQVYCPVYDFQSFNADSLENSITAEQIWRAHIALHNSDLTPCYDLLTILVKNCGYLPSVEECRQFIV